MQHAPTLEPEMSVRRALVALAVAGAALSQVAAAQEQTTSAGWDPQSILRTESYVRPPAEFEKMLLATRPDITFNNPSPDRTWYVRAVGPLRGESADRRKPHVILGGLAMQTRATRARTVTAAR